MKTKRPSALAVTAVIVGVALLSAFAVSAILIAGYFKDARAETDRYKEMDWQLSIEYDSMYLYGKRYVSFEIGQWDCAVGDLIAEIGGGMFSSSDGYDAIYKVVGCEEEYDIVYLNSTYANAPYYFCVEEKYEHYIDLYEYGFYSEYVAEIETDDGYVAVSLSDEIVDAINSFSGSDATDDVDPLPYGAADDGPIYVYIAETDAPFRIPIGELMRIDGEYYWDDYEYDYSIGEPETKTDGMIEDEDYPLFAMPDRLDAALDELFGRTDK